jgi:site-specific DNA-methyltransferase (adenine-specific)
MEVYKSENAVLFQGDCIDILKNTIQASSIDMIFADPPYKLSSGGITCKSGKIACVDKGEWDKPIGFEEDHLFNKTWIGECAKVLKPDGTIWISGTYHNIHSIAFALLELGFYIINEITWFKPNAAPNMGRRCFTASHETLLWAKKGKEAKHCFNYETMKEANQGKQMRSVWSIPTTPKSEKEFGAHPTQKPLALLERVILSSTNTDHLILDPFCGSGTTGVAATRLGRKFIGIESDSEYLQLSMKRLEKAKGSL